MVGSVAGFRRVAAYLAQQALNLASLTVLFAAPALSQGVDTAQIVQPGATGADTALLPNGWKITPAGEQIPVGGFPLRVIAVPHSNLAIATSNGYGDHFLSLIDLPSHHIVERITVGQGWAGLAISADGSLVYSSGGSKDRVFLFRLKSNRLIPDGEISLPTGSFAAGLSLNADGSRLFVTANLADKLLAIDTSTRKVIFSAATGRKPYQCAFIAKHHAVYVTNWGENSVSILDAVDGHPLARILVREKPGDLVASPDDDRVFVTNGDRNVVSVISTETQAVTEEIDTSLNRTPLPGSTPDGLALTPDGHTLFIADANNNSVAVVDVAAPNRSTVLGFLPSGWFPTSLAVVGEGREQRLVIANGKGSQSYENGHKWTAGVANDPNPGFIGRVLQGTLSVVPFTALPKLPEYTARVRSNSPFYAPAPAAAAPFALGPGGPIQHVFYIIKENRTYDQVLGDIPEGNGDPSYALFGAAVTPNQHALAHQFTLIDNLYHNAEISATGHFWADSAIASEYVEKLWPSVNSGRGGKGRPDFHDDPDDYPASGFLWDLCAKKGISYRSYGEFGRIRGAEPGKARPAMGTLVKHINPDYRGADTIGTVSDLERYDIWKREFQSLVRDGVVPAFEVISLPGDHTVGTRPGALTPRAMVAENDLALAKMLDDISHSAIWSNSAIFIIEDDAQNGPDHIDCHRTTAFVVSPYVRRGFVDHTMYSAVSVVRTMELLLGLPSMTQYDAAATPMWPMFQSSPDAAPFTALPAKISLEERNTPKSYGAAESLRMPLEEADSANDDELNNILWKSIKGSESPVPSRRVNASVSFAGSESTRENRKRKQQKTKYRANMGAL